MTVDDPYKPPYGIRGFQQFQFDACKPLGFPLTFPYDATQSTRNSTQRVSPPNAYIIERGPREDQEPNFDRFFPQLTMIRVPSADGTAAAYTNHCGAAQKRAFFGAGWLGPDPIPDLNNVYIFTMELQGELPQNTPT